jgi:hypothetical protein
MSDSIKAWHEMQEEKLASLQADEALAKALKNKEQKTTNPSRDPGRVIETVKYIYVLDFNDGRVYKYDISLLCNDNNKWNPDSESCEAFLIGAGHSISNIEWMVVTNMNSDVVTK